ncbi:DnaJ domain protein [Thermoascus aurantiacus ATCC 26904]
MSPRLRTLSTLFSPAGGASLLNRNLLPSAGREHACAAASASFSTTAAAAHASAREPNYYEILNVPVTATAAEIKKQFYALSLAHHPDRNRSDPTATARFASISSAYHVLSDSTRRARYDRDHGIDRLVTQSRNTSTHSSANPGQHPMGSYSSYGANLHSKGASYVGSRPASGLSKRRGPFRGPPPSFYAHGGYGASARRGPTGATAAGAGQQEGKATPTDEDPTSFIDRNPVYHFDARSHFRTQSAEDARRRERRSRELGIDLDDANLARGGSTALRFLVVSGILIGAGVTAGLSRGPGVPSGSGERAGRGAPSR